VARHPIAALSMPTAGHPADEDDRDRQLRALGPRPGVIVADLRDGPDDAVHLTRAKSLQQHVVDVVGLGLQDQIQHYPVAHLGCLPLDRRH